MILLALLLITLGILLSHWMKAFALIPATVLAWIAAVYLARGDAFSALQTMIAVFLCGACLQLGYLAGTVLVTQRIAHMHKRTVIIVRR